MRTTAILILAALGAVAAPDGAAPQAASPSSRFVAAARAAYGTEAFVGYTNSVVGLYAGRGKDMFDEPRPGDTVRWISVKGARNVRDIGGWTGLREGRVFRGTELNAVGRHGMQIGEAGRKVLAEELGIRTDLDFRAADAKSRGECVTRSAIGDGVRLVDAPIRPYMRMFAQTNKYAAVLRVFADERNYPVYMHCYGGADRTGTVAFILEGLCGVSETDLAIDYELTSFSMFPRSRVSKVAAHAGYPEGGYADIVARIKTYPGASLAEKFAAYARGTLGLTEAEVAAIRRNLAR